MRTLLLKPFTDTKGGSKIISRIGATREIDYFVKKNDDLRILLQDFSNGKQTIACILVDEVQFLSEQQIDQLFEIASLWGIPVICYGLRTDFQLQTFPASGRLLALAHSIEELKTICRCGRKATCNLRLQNGKPIFQGEKVMIDHVGNISYESVCSQCYFELLHQ